MPRTLPLKSIDWTKFISPIGKANFALAGYESIIQVIPNPFVLLSPLSTNEAVLSSKIEGTLVTLQEVLEFQASPDPDANRYEDIQEIINYRKSMHFAVDWLQTRPITLNLLKKIHSILLDSVRGRHKARGSFRRVQNYIGLNGTTIESAMYVPPPPNIILDLLSNLEKYIHYDEKDRLVQLAIIHAQFEIIHPFLDGNGRLGRILIPLFLFEKNLLTSPNFYISAYLEAHRRVYYDRLARITAEDDWEGWINFFLEAIIEQSKLNTQKAKSILGLYNEMKVEIAGLTKSQFSINALDAIFEAPILTSTSFIQQSKIPRQSALRILSKLKDRKILETIRQGSGRRPGLYLFKRLLDIVN